MDMENIMVTLDGAAPHVQLHNKMMITSVVTSASFLSSTKVLSTMNVPWKMKVTFGVPLKLMEMEITMVMKTLDGANQLAPQRKELMVI